MVTNEEKETLIKEVMENYPEYSSGNCLHCTKWNYKKCEYFFHDQEENETVNVTLDSLKIGFDKLFADVIKGKIHIFDTGAIMDGGNWDSTAVDALVQYALFGELKYG